MQQAWHDVLQEVLRPRPHSCRMAIILYGSLHQAAFALQGNRDKLTLGLVAGGLGIYWLEVTGSCRY